MRMFDRICPVCGCLNRELYLEETNGMMECERCGSISCVSFGNEDFQVSIPSGKERRIGPGRYNGSSAGFRTAIRTQSA